jgi:hypothetical protein
MEDENLDPVGPPDRDVLERLTTAAVEVGLLRAGDKPDQNLIDFWMRAVDACAIVADRYPNPDCDGDTVGDAIRAELYE